MQVGGIMRFVDDDVDERPAGELLVQAGGGEVHVPRDKLAFFNTDLAN